MNDQSHSDKWLAEKAHQAMITYGFEPDFGPEIAAQLEAIKSQPISADDSSVRDLRSLLWSSIDNESSRDLDQVEWAEELPNGDIRVLVGIADVDSVVPKNSPIDRRAANNTVTVYTEARIFPMIPEELSTGITSLNEGEDRLAVVAEMIVNEDGNVPTSTFYRALVRNQAKLVYEDVGEWLEGGKPPAKISDNEALAAQVRLQDRAAERLHKYREKKGALEFESIESQAVVENGKITGIKQVTVNEARRLIENFMVAANVEMAEFLENSGPLSLRRVVRVPRRWDGIRKIAGEYRFDLPNEPDQPSLAAFLAERRKADPEHFPDLSLSIIKLIGNGEYVVQRKGEDAGGHFGLAVSDYAHSTAPNRRFTDIVVQRLVKAVISDADCPYTGEELDDIAAQANQQERGARKVERKIRKIVAASVMKHRVGEKFSAIVTGVNENGTFARILRPPVDGRIEKGEHGLDVGEKVGVRLLSADPNTGFIDLEALR